MGQNSANQNTFCSEVVTWWVRPVSNLHSTRAELPSARISTTLYLMGIRHCFRKIDDITGQAQDQWGSKQKAKNHKHEKYYHKNYHQQDMQHRLLKNIIVKKIFAIIYSIQNHLLAAYRVCPPLMGPGMAAMRIRLFISRPIGTSTRPDMLEGTPHVRLTYTLWMVCCLNCPARFAWECSFYSRDGWK